MRRLPLASALAAFLLVAACSREEEPVANRFERAKAEIENKADAYEQQVENEVSALEAALDNEADAALNAGGNAAVDMNASAESNAAR